MMRRGCSVLLDSLSQLPDPVARVAGEGARDRGAADAASAALAADAGAVRRAAAAGACSRVPPELRVVIYRRLMLRIAERLARALARAGAGHRRGHRPGRVADAREPDGDRAARRRWRSCGRWSAWTRTRSSPRRSGIGTFPISIIPDQDCCTLFTPRHPATRATRGRSKQAEQALPIDEMVDAAVLGSRSRRLQAIVIGGSDRRPGSRSAARRLPSSAAGTPCGRRSGPCRRRAC